MTRDQTAIAVITNTLENIEKSIDEIKVKLDKDYVTKDTFEPIKKLVYGLVGIILLTVVGGLLSFIIRKP